MPDSPSPGEAPEITSAANPGIGCFIMACAAFILLGVAVFFVFQGLRMDREINTFTDPEPVQLPLTTPSPEQKAALDSRLKAFAEAATAGEQVELSLSVEDLNHLVASTALLEDYRGTARVTGINDFFIITEFSQLLNRVLPGAPRYLNATFSLSPFLKDDKTVRLDVKSITSSRHDIPQGFVDLYSQKHVLQFDGDNELLGPILKHIHQIEIRDGRVFILTEAPRSP
jgi:hypothetical protein